MGEELGQHEGSQSIVAIPSCCKELTVMFLASDEDAPSFGGFSSITNWDVHVSYLISQVL